jgi:hypothetical protein
VFAKVAASKRRGTRLVPFPNAHGTHANAVGTKGRAAGVTIRALRAEAAKSWRLVRGEPALENGLENRAEKLP